MPGYWALSTVVFVFDLPRDGWNGFPLLIAANCLLYGVIGFFVGRFSSSWKSVARKGAIVCVLTALAALLFGVLLPKIRDHRHLDQMVRERTSALQSNPEDVGSLHWLGFHHLTRTRRLADAERFLAEVVAIESRKTVYSESGQRSLLYLAVIYQTQGKEQAAERMYRMFIGTGPDLDGDVVLRYWSREYLSKSGKPEAGDSPGPAAVRDE